MYSNGTSPAGATQTVAHKVGEAVRRGACTVIADMDRRELRVAFAGSEEEHVVATALPARVRPWVRTNELNRGHACVLRGFRKVGVPADSQPISHSSVETAAVRRARGRGPEEDVE